MKTMTRCRHASTYKATRAPTCGCDVCMIRWDLTELHRALSARLNQLDLDVNQLHVTINRHLVS